jgi:hypothetical protein
MRQYDLPWLRADAEVGQLANQVMAQRFVAEAAAVAKERAQPGPNDLVVVLVQTRAGQPFDRRKAVADAELVGFPLELLPHQPDDVHRAAERSRFFLLRRALGRGQHVVTRAAARLDDAARDQQLERGHHGVLRIAVQLGELAQRWQLVTRAEGAVGDLSLQRRGQRGGDGRGFRRGRCVRHEVGRRSVDG